MLKKSGRLASLWDMQISFISDVISSERAGAANGGAALNDDVLCKGLRLAGHDVRVVNSKNLGSIGNEYVLLSNFFNVKPELLSELVSRGRYSIVAHDYKFVAHMNPAVYADFLVPADQRINLDLFSRADNVFCQSNLQKGIYDKNVTSKTHNLSGNLWDTETISFMGDLSRRNKLRSGVTAVVKSPYPQKGVAESIQFCIQNRLDYDLVSDKVYHCFLNKLAQFEGLCFVPQVPETLSRVCVEAKIMGLSVLTTKMVGAVGEEWWSLDKDALSEKLVADQKRIPTEILERITA